ncbi:MAG: nucleotidyltransferase domain-containing protein [Bacteroidia bacterium]|nr:nucleotidyltransferase domain-containing protein [Bacteroidia bacterium]
MFEHANPARNQADAQDYKPQFSAAYGLSGMAIFGSYARNPQTGASDVDIVVEFSRPIGSAFIDLAEELGQLLQERVDLVSKKGPESGTGNGLPKSGCMSDRAPELLLDDIRGLIRRIKPLG